MIIDACIAGVVIALFAICVMHGREIDALTKRIEQAEAEPEERK